MIITAGGIDCIFISYAFSWHLKQYQVVSRLWWEVGLDLLMVLVQPPVPSAPFHMQMMLQSSDDLPINIGFTGKIMALIAAYKLATILLFILLLRPPAASSHEVEEEEFSYDVKSENGPDKWGSLHAEWAACGVGRLQSPIDLDPNRVMVADDLGNFRQSYKLAKATLKNRGHDIMLRWEEDAGGVWINGTLYSLKQLHWHSPSEHAVNGSRFVMEAHMVHENDDKKIAVVAIVYIAGRPDSLLAKLESYIRKLTDLEEKEESVGLLDLMEVKWGSEEYYRYMGSLTTPPCTEGVIWTITKKVRTVSIKQMRLLRDAVHDGFEENARPIQPTNGRDIYLYRQRKIVHLNSI